MVSVEKKMGVVKDGKIIIPHKYDYIAPMLVNGEESEFLFEYRDGKKSGAILYDHETGGYIYRAESFAIKRNFVNNVAIIQKRNFMYSLINSELKYLTKKDYHEIKFAKNCYIAKIGDNIDIYDLNGNLWFENLIHATVDGEKSDTLFITSKNPLFGLLRIKEGKVAEEVEADFTSINEFVNGVAIVTIQYEFGLRYGLLNIKFDEIIEPVYDDIYMLNKDLYAVKQKDKFGVYSVSKKKFIIPFEFSAVSFTRTELGNTISVSI